MVPADGGQHRHHGRWDHVGGVQRAPHARLQHHNLTLLLGKIQKRQRRVQLKFRRQRIFIQSAAGQFFCQTDIGLAVYLFAVYLYLLPHAVKIGRGIQPCAVSCLTQHGGEHFAHGTFAVCACHMDKPALPLRVS